jgi:hypothetical protein
VATVSLCSSAPLRESNFSRRAAEIGTVQNPTGWPAFAGHDSWGGGSDENGAANAGKPPLFSDGYILGAVRELEGLYAPTVAVPS